MIKCVSPRVVAIEYNGKLPPNFEYDAKHVWRGDDEHGASLKSSELLGEKPGCQLAGTNIREITAFFVKENLTKKLFVNPAAAETLYNPARWPTTRYISGHPSKKYIGTQIRRHP